MTKTGIFTFFIFALLAFPSTSQAGVSHLGNGGDGVVCKGIEEILPLDLHESFMAGGYSYVKTGRLSIREILDEASDRIERVMPGFGVVLRQYTRAFENNLVLVDPSEIIDIDDDFGRVRPDCEIVQLANLFPFSGMPFLLKVNRVLWARMSQLGKAALLLHEAIYLHQTFYLQGRPESHHHSVSFARQWNSRSRTDFLS